MPKRLIVFTAALLLAMSGTVLACGDSLYRVGKGVAYRTYSAPLPGNLLIFGNTQGAVELAERLEESGHGVQVVTNVFALGSELRGGNYDVVIAPFSDRAYVSGDGIGADYLPIVFSKEEALEARDAYDQVMNAEKAEIKHYLKAIHRKLKKKA